jgi:hypothetical protein
MTRIIRNASALAAALLLTAAAPEGFQQKQAASAPAKVDLDDLEKNPAKYLGKALTVTGEVNAVLGPKLFEIDEPNWADPDREVLVYTDAPVAALVDEDDRVTVTGTLMPFAEVKMERDWGYSRLGPEVKARISTRPVLVAKHLVDAKGQKVMEIILDPSTPTGTTGTGDTQGAISSADSIAKATDTALVGRKVVLQSAKVDRVESDGAFWVRTPSGESVYVMPSNNTVKVQAGQTVNIEGRVLRSPDHLKAQAKGAGPVYVYATSIKAA